MNIMKYTTKIKLFNSNFDLCDKIKPSAIFNIFQDVASYHGNILGVGYDAMIEKNLYWVLSRVKYDILKNPKIDEEVIVETWPIQKGRIDFDRDFKISNTLGEVLIIGSSKWCVINSNTRILERTDNVNYPYECLTEKVYDTKFNKTESVEKNNFPNYTHIVEYSEIDHNQHLNNVNYAIYVSNTLKTSFKHLQINFISECKLGDKIEIFKSVNENNEQIISGYVGDTLKFSALAK